MKKWKRVSIKVDTQFKGPGLTEFLNIKLNGKLPIPEKKESFKTTVAFNEYSPEYKKLMRYARAYFNGSVAGAISFILEKA